MPNSYTVGELTTSIRELLETQEFLQDLWVQGEVSNMKRAASGHWYFTLKDSAAQLKCVMWRSSTERQGLQPQDGDAILVHGYVGIYEPQGAYQLYADAVRPVGMGDLYTQFEMLKAKLQAEGLFDPGRKRPIPLFPHQIGVVTSPEAAAFQDIQNVLRRRFPLAEVILSPTLVQGADAPPQIAAAIERLNRFTEVDVILLCRGGGSLEDLWAFNDERVARAVAASRIPIITGVGHETDTTIVDFVSDLRAPTPSAAAEIATPNRDDLRADVTRLSDGLTGLIEQHLSDGRALLSAAQRTLRFVSPASRIRDLRQRVDERSARLDAAPLRRIDLLKERLHGRLAALNSADPRAILRRGYAIVTRSTDGERLTQSAGTTPGTALTIQFHDGELKARVEDKDSHERYQRTLF